ncbi:MAG TPA: hypothetical protein VIM16_16965 [Mucilaginibacter sp.]|jgi:hypothetical protein
MTTLTFEIPDQEADTVSQIIRKKGGTLIANSKDDLSKAEQISLNQSLKEAELIKSGKLKGLTFDELWDE